MLKKFYRSLGDTPWEFLGNLLILILVGPIWLVLNAIAYAWDFIYRLLRLPAPKQVPLVVGDKDLSEERKARAYIDKFKEIVGEVEVDQEKSSSMLTVKVRSKHASVDVWWDDYAIGISIDELNTGYWHSAEEKNLDLPFWVAVGALRNGVKWKRSWTGRKEGWVYSDEMDIWVVVSTGDGFSDYYKFRRRFKK